MMIRMWTRTAARKEITSFGMFLSTLCHEFCHHLDLSIFSGLDSLTRGIREVFPSVPLRCNTMSVEHRTSDCSGCQWQMGAGESIGHARIVVRDLNGSIEGRMGMLDTTLRRQMISSKTVDPD